MRNLYFCSVQIILALLLSFVAGSVKSQTVSEYALIKRKIFVTPEIWEITKSVSNSELDIDLFNYPKAGVFAIDMRPDNTLRSSLFAVIDPSWNRVIYSDMNEDFIKSFGTFGSGSCQFKWPQSIAAHAISDGVTSAGFYDIYIADTYNDRVCKATYVASSNEIVCGLPITGNGLFKPIDIAIDNGGTYIPNTDDHIWVLNGDNKMLRFTFDGTLEYTVETPAGCKASAIAYGRYYKVFLADTSNYKIYSYWYDNIEDKYLLYTEVSTTSSIVDLATDALGHVWALDENGTITKYNDHLDPLCTFGSSGTGDNQFLKPSCISFANGAMESGDVFITESWTETSGIQHYAIGTDVVDVVVHSNSGNSEHSIYCLLIDLSKVKVEIYDNIGNKVRTLITPTFFNSGPILFYWDGTDDNEEQVPPGVYTYSIKSTSAYVDAETGIPVNEVVKTGAIYHIVTCCVGIRGNVDGSADDIVDISDLDYLTVFMFGNPQGPAPPCFEEADLDCSG